MDCDSAPPCLTAFSRAARLIPRIGVVSFLAFQLWGCGGGNSSPQQVNFSDYYPMVKGAYRTYLVTAPGQPTSTASEAITSGATYDGLASVRTCRSPGSWSDDVSSAGQIIRSATAGDGLAPSFPFVPLPDPLSIQPGVPIALTLAGPPPFGPFTLGIDPWEAGQTVVSSVPVFLRSNIPPIPLPIRVTFRGLEAVTVPAGIFRKSMKVDSSLVLNDASIAFSSAKTDWYALGLGMVKSIHYGGVVPPGELPHEIVETWELTDHGMLSSLPPQLLSISPSAGPVAGGTEVTLAGNFFSSGAQVTISQLAVTSVTVVSPTEIKAVTLPGISATLDVTVVNADCQVSIKEDAFTFQ